MVIECNTIDSRSLPSELIRPELGLGIDRIFALKLGKPYVVYGITYALGHLWYYVIDERNLSYPVWYPSPIFSVINSQVSVFWRVGIHSIGIDNIKIPIISFREWVDGKNYYEMLMDGDSQAISIFEKYKKMMDDEAGQ